MKECPFCHQTIKELKVSQDDLRKVVRGFQIVQGYGEVTDKQWLKSYFQVNCRSAKKLLVLMGNWKDAIDCIQETYEKLQAWKEDVKPSLERIYTNHALTWKQIKMEKEAKFGN